MDVIKAWQRDAEGWFIEMLAGAQKPFSIDWTKFLAEIPGDTLASAVWVIPVGLTKVTQAEAGNVAQVKLSALTAGIYHCTHTMTSAQAVIELVLFRVIVE